ncbi:hypothetical protein DES52_110132 [Deinococcus yavapaiensis KR-236]|uniref:OpgC protein n=2 Tax=Deinococcus TaxID=1298 RepID=A0A318S3Q9_9DEIO|nr:hypothetical protein DES52_110132 [Deinococcus yavapaiensis KR-236]
MNSNEALATLDSPSTASAPSVAAATEPRARRDTRIDVLRGLVIVVILVNHVDLRSLYHVLSVEAIGVVTAAEAFVLLSGFVLGFVSRVRLQRDGFRAVVARCFRRAGTIYLAALTVNVLVYLLGLVPSFDARVLTSYTDKSTGVVYSLYDAASPAHLALGLVTLKFGPGQINVLGLYVALLLLAPLALWSLRRGRWWLLLALSWSVFALGHLHLSRLLPSQSENAFPLELWQVLFVHGLAAGYERRRLATFARSSAGRVLLAFTVVAFAVLCFFALNNPWVDVPGGLRMHFIPEGAYGRVYGALFERRELGLGRALNTMVVVVVLYLALTRLRGPALRAAERVLVPLGQATLYVFLVHVLLVLLVAQFGFASRSPGWSSTLVNTFVHTAVIAVIWWMVRAKFLFGLIPR